MLPKTKGFPWIPRAVAAGTNTQSDTLLGHTSQRHSGEGLEAAGFEG